MFTVNANAKINWFLHVLSKREDGYHDILSLMQCITLSDSLTFEDSASLELVTAAPVPLDRNLVYRAMTLLKEVTGFSGGARVTLLKDIPLAAGLGGGSSDAASALAGLNRLWGLNLTEDDLAGLGERLGSDVPFFFKRPVAFVEGKGEIVSPLEMVRSYPVVLVKPPIEVSSEWAYEELDKTSSAAGELTGESNNIKLFCQALEKGDFSLLPSVWRNDLEIPVVSRFPVIGEIKDALRGMGALFSSMSGSGPTVFGVFESEAKADEASERMLPYWSRVVRTVSGNT